MCYAAIDANVHAVYATGSSASDAMSRALELGITPSRSLSVVPCTNRAANFVVTHGGAPSKSLSVTFRGVCLANEED